MVAVRIHPTSTPSETDGDTWAFFYDILVDDLEARDALAEPLRFGETRQRSKLFIIEVGDPVGFELHQPFVLRTKVVNDPYSRLIKVWLIHDQALRDPVERAVMNEHHCFGVSDGLKLL